MLKTVLCVPGHDAEKVAKCRKYGADLILFDLEDSVPMAQKAEARRIVLEAAGPEDAVRLNAPGTPEYQQDLMAFRSRELHSLWVPKIRRFDSAPAAAARVVFIVETAEAVLALPRFREEATLLPIRGLAFGIADFCSSARTVPWSEQVSAARLQVALAAAALGIDAYDGPPLITSESPESSASFAWRNGFTHKCVLMPWMIGRMKSGVLSGAQLSPISPDSAETMLMFHDKLNGSRETVVRYGNSIVAPPMLRMLRRIASLNEKRGE